MPIQGSSSTRRPAIQNAGGSDLSELASCRLNRRCSRGAKVVAKAGSCCSPSRAQLARQGIALGGSPPDPRPQGTMVLAHWSYCSPTRAMPRDCHPEAYLRSQSHRRGWHFCIPGVTHGHGKWIMDPSTHPSGPLQLLCACQWWEALAVICGLRMSKASPWSEVKRTSTRQGLPCVRLNFSLLFLPRREVLVTSEIKKVYRAARSDGIFEMTKLCQNSAGCAILSTRNSDAINTNSPTCPPFGVNSVDIPCRCLTGTRCNTCGASAQAEQSRPFPKRGRGGQGHLKGRG